MTTVYHRVCCQCGARLRSPDERLLALCCDCDYESASAAMLLDELDALERIDAKGFTPLAQALRVK
jgi:NMD protein affecting ribosome stability and mRNA decay